MEPYPTSDRWSDPRTYPEEGRDRDPPVLLSLALVKAVGAGALGMESPPPANLLLNPRFAFHSFENSRTGRSASFQSGSVPAGTRRRMGTRRCSSAAGGGVPARFPVENVVRSMPASDSTSSPAGRDGALPTGTGSASPSTAINAPRICSRPRSTLCAWTARRGMEPSPVWSERPAGSQTRAGRTGART